MLTRNIPKENAENVLIEKHGSHSRRSQVWKVIVGEVGAGDHVGEVRNDGLWCAKLMVIIYGRRRWGWQVMVRGQGWQIMLPLEACSEGSLLCGVQCNFSFSPPMMTNEAVSRESKDLIINVIKFEGWSNSLD